MAEIDGICLNGFSEPVTIDELRRTRYADIPNTPGIYLIINASGGAPRFLVKSTGGWFKRKDPSYSPDVVKKSWIEGARVVYVGIPCFARPAFTR